MLISIDWLIDFSSSSAAQTHLIQTSLISFSLTLVCQHQSRVFCLWRKRLMLLPVFQVSNSNNNNWIKMMNVWVFSLSPDLQLSQSVHQLTAVVLQIRLHVSLLVRTKVLITHSVFRLIRHRSHLKHTRRICSQINSSSEGNQHHDNNFISFFLFLSAVLNLLLLVKVSVNIIFWLKLIWKQFNVFLLFVWSTQ